MSKKVITLEDIFESLKEQKKEIKDAKEDNTERIEKFMEIIETNISEVRKDVSVLNGLMEERERENRERHKITEEKIEEGERRRTRDRYELNDRMRKMEIAINREIRISGRREDREKTQEERPWQKTTKMTKTRKTQEEVNREEEDKASEERAPEENVSLRTGEKISSSWHKTVCEELREAAEKAEISKEIKKKVTKEKRNKKLNNGMKSLKKWFAKESPDSSVVTTESDTEDNETEMETVDRRARNKERRKKNLLNRKAAKAEIAHKASLTLGCKPIREEEIKELTEKTGDIKLARREAVFNYLRNYLQYNEEELREVKIHYTRVSPKGDMTIYAVFSKIDTIKEIHMRAAEIRNPAIMLRNYVPPQYWARYMHLSRECTNYRYDYPQMKTQLRFGDRDVEIMLKRKGSDEIYKKVPYETITDPRNIPEFEFNMKFNNQRDRPQRRKLIPFHDDSSRMEDVEMQPASKLQRQRSVREEENQMEKRRKMDEESSSSASGSGSSHDTEADEEL